MSVNSSTDIANLALDLLSGSQIQSIDSPTSATESLIARWYDTTRRKVLREHPWGFATKRIVLAPDSADPAFGYSAAFSVPSDFLRLLDVATNLSDTQETFLPKKYYQFEQNRILLNDYYGDNESLNLIYIFDNTNVSQYDPLFIDLLAHDLALAIAYKVSETNTNVQRLEQLTKTRGMLAKAVEGQERPPTRVERSHALSARRRAGRTTRTDRLYFD